MSGIQKFENFMVIRFILLFQGSKLNLVAGEDDVKVTVGVGNCDVIELRETNLTCVAPTNQPAPGMPGANFPEVNVRTTLLLD